MKHRKHGTGTLILRGGKWFARWIYDGKQYQRTTGTANRKEAEKRLAEFTADFQRDGEAATLARQTARLGGIREEQRQAEDARPALALADAWDAYEGSMERGEVSAFTLGVYRSRFGAFVEWMRRHFPAVAEVRAVTDEHAAAFMRELSATKSGKTFNDYRAILIQVWRILAHDKRARLAGNPWQGIKPREKDTFTRRELTVEELAGVIASVSGEMRVLFAVGIYTGLRLGDAVSLDWGAVDLVRGFIDATPHKTRKHGTRVHIPIAPVLRGILEETPPADRRGPVMPGLLAEYAKDDSWLARRIGRVFRECGIETQAEVSGTARKRVAVGFHSLRHTFVSLCANGGVPLAVVQSIVGHTNAAMTRHYFHVADDALRGAADALPDVVTVDAEAVDAPQGQQNRAVMALPGPGAASVPADVPGASGGVLDALAALVARMDAGELDEASRIVNAARRRNRRTAK